MYMWWASMMAREAMAGMKDLWFLEERRRAEPVENLSCKDELQVESCKDELSKSWVVKFELLKLMQLQESFSGRMVKTLVVI